MVERDQWANHVWKRARAYHAQGLSDQEIANKVLIPLKTVQRWRKTNALEPNCVSEKYKESAAGTKLNKKLANTPFIDMPIDDSKLSGLETWVLVALAVLGTTKTKYLREWLANVGASKANDVNTVVQATQKCIHHGFVERVAGMKPSHFRLTDVSTPLVSFVRDRKPEWFI